ncbi:hypothetical protein MO867_12445 [Microbulbifer sp. OS29]|uniref:Alpha/beta hydrolase family protein n=1 Tax=Microbulbifer okhotskensis TaxID=2926617 RepID=A0A9X2ENW8_9GAMM|nr:hypothetical protein [Microbulbifer okhotskensis]MCO1335141.1 hypothetical protein [Microbulbifer okhotskensis]
MKRSLIMLVPGLTRVTSAAQLSEFTEGLIAASERIPLTSISDPTIPAGVQRLRVTSGSDAQELDLVEAYWNDLVPSITQQSLKTRLARGFSLIWFWLANLHIWRGVLKRKYLTFGLTLSALAFIVWYIGTIILFIEAIDPASGSPFYSIIQQLKQGVEYIGGWRIWVIATAIVAIMPVSLLVDVSDFCKRYLTNEPAAKGKPAVRFEIIRRVREQLENSLKMGEYDSVTIVGHSFGSVVAVDLFADLPPIGMPVRILTMGSLIEVLGKQASWLQKEVEHLSLRKDLVEWIDIKSHADWFASGSAVPPLQHCHERIIGSYGTFPDKLAARVHSRYFDNQEAVKLLLSYYEQKSESELSQPSLEPA